jgi:hypothetical protein
VFRFRQPGAKPLPAGNTAFGRPGLSRRTLEILRIEMIATGQWLNDVLEVEQTLRWVHPAHANEEALAALKECRKTVDRLADDYASAAARWRGALAVELANQQGERIPVLRGRGRPHAA